MAKGRKRKGRAPTRKSVRRGKRSRKSVGPRSKSLRPRKSVRGSKIRSRPVPLNRGKSARGKSGSTGARRASKRVGGTTSRRERKPLPARVRKQAEAMRELGAGALKRVSLPIGETGWLTPTGQLRGRSQGFGAVRRTLDAITNIPEAALFSFTLVVSFNGPRGRERREYPHIGIPVDIRNAEALTNKVLSVIHDTIFKEIIPAAFGTYPNVRTVDNRETAEEMLRDVKQQRGIRFKLRFYREVIHHAASKETPRRLRGRLGGRFGNKSVPLRNRGRKVGVDVRNKAKRPRQTPRLGKRGKKKGKGS